MQRDCELDTNLNKSKSFDTTRKGRSTKGLNKQDITTFKEFSMKGL